MAKIILLGGQDVTVSAQITRQNGRQTWCMHLLKGSVHHDPAVCNLRIRHHAMKTVRLCLMGKNKRKNAFESLGYGKIWQIYEVVTGCCSLESFQV